MIPCKTWSNFGARSRPVVNNTILLRGGLLRTVASATYAANPASTFVGPDALATANCSFGLGVAAFAVLMTPSNSVQALSRLETFTKTPRLLCPTASQPIASFSNVCVNYVGEKPAYSVRQSAVSLRRAPSEGRIYLAQCFVAALLKDQQRPQSTRACPNGIFAATTPPAFPSD
jgi:hypothetical protein